MRSSCASRTDRPPAGIASSSGSMVDGECVVGTVVGEDRDFCRGRPGIYGKNFKTAWIEISLCKAAVALQEMNGEG